MYNWYNIHMVDMKKHGVVGDAYTYKTKEHKINLPEGAIKPENQEWSVMNVKHSDAKTQGS